MEHQLISNARFLGILPMFILALKLVLRNYRGKLQSVIYSRSCDMLIVATLLLATHFLIQYVWHLREQSVTLCWTVNMAFYIVITPLYNMAELNLLRAGHNMKQCYWQNALFVALCYLVLAIGFFSGTLINDAQPYLTATFVVALLYSAKLIELSWVLSKEMRVADVRLANDELTERHHALHYTAKVMYWIILLSLFTPWVGMSSSLLLNSVFGITIFILIIWFLLRFLNYGENMTELIKVNNEITEAVHAETVPQEKALQPYTAEETSTDDLQQRIELWISQRRYTDPTLTISEALSEMGISSKLFNLYLLQHTNVPNYRSWLPMLRIEEAKRVMMQHPEYSLQAVANACGYANSGNLSRAFKAQEGISPSEWAMKANKSD